MAASGVRTFVEVGPGSVLTRLNEAILTEAGFSECEFFALDVSWGKTVWCARLGECSDAFAGSRSSSQSAGVGIRQSMSTCPGVERQTGTDSPADRRELCFPARASTPRIAQWQT